MTEQVLPTPKGASLAVARAVKTKPERFKAFSHALQAVDDPRCPRPIPRFMVDMPWSNEDDQAAERIIAKLLSADDPYAAQNAGETLSGKDLVGRRVTVHDIRCSPSQFKGGWGAYLLCDVTVDGGDDHEIMTMGAKEPVALLSYAWFTGDIPITGTPTVITETAGGNTVLGFIVEREL